MSSCSLRGIFNETFADKIVEFWRVFWRVLKGGHFFLKIKTMRSYQIRKEISLRDEESSSLRVTDACQRTVEFRRQFQWLLFRQPKCQPENRTAFDRELPKKGNIIQSYTVRTLNVLGPSKTAFRPAPIRHQLFYLKYCTKYPY